MAHTRRPASGIRAATIGAIGVGTMVTGLVADLDAHLVQAVDASAPASHLAHLIGIVGMVIVLVAVVSRAPAQRRNP